MGIDWAKNLLGATLPLSLQFLGSSTGFPTSICVAAHDEQERWHSSTTVTQVPWAWWQHSTWESCIHGQILKGVGGSGKSHLNLPQENGLSTPVPATAETKLFQFSQASWKHQIQWFISVLEMLKAINSCRFLQTFTFHGRFSTQVLLPAVVC